jgi:hypothetical protein
MERYAMNSKIVCKIFIDIAMTVLLLILMANHLTGYVLHEWIGVAIYILFITHHILNIHWFKNLFRGKHTLLRILLVIVNALIFLAMVGLMISGIILSQYIFTFFNIRGGISFARKLHMLLAYWGFLLISLHLGFHWRMFIGSIRKIIKIKDSSRTRTIVLRIVAILITAYGIYAFCKRELGTYLFLKNMFVFRDLNEHAITFFLDYIAIMGLCIFIAHYTVRFKKG